MGSSPAFCAVFQAQINTKHGTKPESGCIVVVIFPRSCLYEWQVFTSTAGAKTCSVLVCARCKGRTGVADISEVSARSVNPL